MEFGLLTYQFIVFVCIIGRGLGSRPTIPAAHSMSDGKSERKNGGTEGTEGNEEQREEGRQE
jgi:hypothetical protein